MLAMPRRRSVVIFGKFKTAMLGGGAELLRKAASAAPPS